MGKQVGKKFFAVFLTFLLIVSSFPQLSFANEETKGEISFDDIVAKGIYDPNEDYKYLDVRFWKDEAPGVGFYISNANLYNLTTVPEPGFGTSNGEWTVMDLLRGLYGGYYYNEALTTDYFDGYIERIEQYVSDREGNLDRNKSTEWSRSILALSALGYDITNVAGYDYIEKLSDSYSFSFRQGINGPIWELIAMNTGPYDFYTDESNDDVNTEGKMLDYILERQVKQDDGTIGGWVLGIEFGFNTPSSDITGMALQALAPYYKDKALFEATDSTHSYEDLVEAVERALYVLDEMQLDNGGYAAFGNVNVESTVQVVAALAALGIDPISSVELPHIGKTANFVTEGAVHDGVKTDNMVDKLLTFWSPGTVNIDLDDLSKEEQEVYRIAGGFKHVTSGDDGGGGSGYGVDGMATDQSIYGLIAYDRFKKGLNDLYDMSDMVNGEYKDMLKATEQTITFENDTGTEVKKGKRYGVVELPKGQESEGKTFIEWNSKEDGTGTAYEAEEFLVVPEQDVTLYAQYEYETYTIEYELNGGTFISEDIVKDYTNKEDVILPTQDDVLKDGYTFIGWFENANFSGDKIEKITKEAKGDKVFYAKWEEAINEDEIAGKEVNELIENLPTPENVTIEHKTEVENVRNAYEALSSEAKEYVTKVSKLEVLEAKIIQLENEKEFTEKKAALEAEISKALETEMRKITNESAEQLGSSVGKAENVLRQSERISSAPALFAMRSTTVQTDYDTLLQKLSSSLAELQDAIEQIQYKSEEDVEEVLVVSHLYFEVARLSVYDLEEVSTEKKEEIEQTISNAKQLLEDETVTQDEIDDLTSVLQNIIEQFDDEEQSVDKTELEKAIEIAESEDITNKTEASVIGLEEAINDAKEILAKDSATKEDVEQAIRLLEQAIAALENEVVEDKVNKETLQKAYDASKEIDVSNKTAESKKTLETAQENAKTVLSNDDVTQEEVNEALKNLQDAMDGLEKIEVSKPDEDDKGNGDDNSKPTPAPTPSPEEPSEDGKDEDTPEKSENGTEKEDEQKDKVTEGSPSSTKDDGTIGETKIDKNDTSTLPKTATPMFSVMFIGFMLILIGFAYFVFQYVVRRKQM